MDQDDHITTLMSMGFENVEEIKKALRLGKNDINEAVAILTNEQTDFNLMSNYGDSKHEANNRALVPTVAPPPYDTYPSESEPPKLSCNSPQHESSGVPVEFPTTNLYELEQRVFTDRWSIPYKKEESLGKCLVSAIYYAEEGLCEVDENCRRFIEYCMPEAFKKLLTSVAVRGWALEVHEGVRNMLHLFLNLAVARLKYDPVSIPVLQVLEKVFDPDSEYNIRNKTKQSSSTHLADVLGHGQPFATSKDSMDSYGWLVDFVNKFGQLGGFTELQARFKYTSISCPAMAALLLPLAKCAEFLNPIKVCPVLSPCMDRSVEYIRSLTDEDIKSKNVHSVCELSRALKLLCLHLWPPQVQHTNVLCREVILRMLKCPHFNARMNGLKAVMKLIDDSLSFRNLKAAIESEDLLNWFAENKVLTIVLEGNIDQVQYTDKIKGIIEFLGHKLSLDELTKIWKMQEGQNAQIIDNIHTIMTAASSKFNSEQFDHLLELVQNTWENSSDQIKKRIIVFIGRLGKDTNQGKTSMKILDLLWELAHYPALPVSVVEMALEEHFLILADVSHKDQTKKQFCQKCIEDIKRGTFVLPSLKLLHNICKNLLKSGTYKQDRAGLNELNKANDIIKLVTGSLVRSHQQAVVAAKGGQLNPGVLVDGQYSHEDYLVEHLNFLQFILQDGAQYLPWNRARDIWDCLVSNSEACNSDKEICFEWFTKCLQDLETDTQSNLFLQKLLQLDPTQLTSRGFSCFKTYFENVNTAEQKLKKPMFCLTVEKLDLTGVGFLWQVALSSDDSIANDAIHYLLEISYHSLSSKLKKDMVSLHKRLINECYTRLERILATLGTTAMFTAVTKATKTLTAISVSEVATIPAPTRAASLLNICRLLQVAERYVSSIEETHIGLRTILPHGTFFLGHPIFLRIYIESLKEEYVIVSHSNESLGSIKHRIAQHFRQPFSKIHILQDDVELSKEKNQRLIGQFPFIDQQVLIVKCPGGTITSACFTEVSSGPTTDEEKENFASFSVSSSSSEATSWTSHHSFLLEQEKQLPGVVMASGGQAFEMLYQLASLDEPDIIAQVRRLLHLIPTDPATLDALDSIGAKKIIELPSPTETSRGSPRSSPKKFTVNSPIKEKIESPKEILRNLFDISLQLSPFKLLYSLEILSGKLMPVMQDAGTIQSADIFRSNFLSAGGLKLILGILQKDSICNEIDYSIRQSCYMAALTISRYLLCNQTGLEIDSASSLSCSVNTNNHNAKDNIIGFPIHCTAPDLSCSGIEVHGGRKAIDELKQTELLDTLSSLMRIAWAAAAGNLILANSCLPSKEGHYYGGRRSRQSSSGSNASSGSESSDGFALHGGVCSQQLFVSPMDSLLSRKALKFLVLCIQLRPDIFSSFSKLQCNRDFFIDVLLGSPSREVRYCAMEQFYNLSQLHESCNPSPKHYMLQILLKAHLPLWVSSSSIRGTNQRLLDQCKEYFELGCNLLDGLTEEEQKSLQIDAKQMVEDEITWLQGFSPSSMILLHSADSALMTGHFKFVKTLLRCEGVAKGDVGRILVPDLLQNFLFPASHLISTGTANAAASSITPKCLTLESRVAAYDVLVELGTACTDNLEKVVKQLSSMHHYVKPELAKEFDYEPLVAERAVSGYVGLKNAGATCYMNSVIQQLYMQPGVKEFILSVDEDNPDEDSLFYQFQMVFGHLLESRLQYHTPENFWRCFRMWGEPINVREQQDAFEFFTHLIDQIDEYLKKNEWDPIFKQKYEGMFSDQKICHGCPHRYEREETFMALNLPVKSHNLLDSLDQFVKGELLEGQNAYFCEKCHEKRNAIKRTCIKTLPPVLVIQLKRFDYDWEANRSLKFDDYFKFPWQLDMAPYTTEGIQEKESLKQSDEEDNQVVPTTPGGPKPANTLYELVGVIVHSGQANAGHYYSYIKERRLDSGPNLGKWFKFNDTTVGECEMIDATLEAECFGGTYKAKMKDTSNSYPETRQRYWNAYLLFYEKAEDTVKTPRTPRKTPNKFSFRKSENDVTASASRNLFKQSSSGGQSGGPYRHRDSLSQLTRLVDRGERHGLFLDKMPARIQQVVREENLRFMHNRDVYNDSYFAFVHKLVSVNTGNMDNTFATVSVNSLLPLSVSFLFNTYLRYKNKDSHHMTDWTNSLETIISCCKEASVWFIDFLGSDIGLSYMKPFLLECPNREVRQVFSRLLEKGIGTFFFHGGETGSSSLDHIIMHLLDLLSQDVPDNCRSCSQYFGLLCMYAQSGSKTCAHMLANNAFHKFLVFLLGPAAADMRNEEAFPRRWNPVQTQDFGSLHATMAFLVLHCDLVPHRTCDLGAFEELTSVWASNDSTINMPEEIQSALYGPGAFRYVQEVVSACREASGSISVFVDMLVQCSFCNEIFSSLVISQVMLQYSCVPSNELTNLLYLLLEILTVEDPLQFLRIRLVIDGSPQDKHPAFDGILSVIRANQASDSRRSYQGVKFLVSLAHKCSVAKEYLMRTPNKWQWSVNWLKKKMTEHSYLINTSNTPLSNEDSNTKNFQRTVSAQDTLDEATALLTGVDSPESPDVTMDVDDDEEKSEVPVETIIPINQEVSEDVLRKLKRAQGMNDLDSIDY